MHLGRNLRATSFQFRIRNHAVHRLHLFDRERLNELVADHTHPGASANARKIAIVHEMVGHLDLRIFIRSMRLFLPLRKDATRSACMDVSEVSNFGRRISFGLSREPFHFRNQPRSAAFRSQNGRGAPPTIADLRTLYLEEAV